MTIYKIGKSKDTKISYDKFKAEYLKGGYSVIVVSNVETIINKDGVAKFRIRKED